MRPYGFYFTPEQFKSYPKMSTRCDPAKAIKVVDGFPEAKRWFRRHPQFQHIFHMDLHTSRMCMGIWLLALRTVDTHDRSQCWFVVNGVPIRYSIREHGLLSGLHCHNYPDRLENLGSMKFVERHFGKKKPEVNDVLEKLTSMEKQGESRVRLKMVVLYFLAVVIKGRQKSVGGAIEDFLLRVVDDLNLCKSFPWGRYTFDDCLYQVYKMVDKQKTRVTATQCLPGFVLPLEVLAFECIEPLKSRFREAIEPVEGGCPILCRGKFNNPVLKGFSLQELYDELGDSKAINSTVVYEGEVENAHIAP